MRASALLLSRRRRATLACGIVALLGAAGGLASWFAASGTGPFGARGGTASQVTLTIAPVTAQNVIGGCTPQTSPCPIAADVTNPSSATLTIATASSAGPAEVVGLPSCNLAPHVSLVTPSPLVGRSLPPGTTRIVVEGALTLDAQAPICAAGQDWLIPITLTAS